MTNGTPHSATFTDLGRGVSAEVLADLGYPVPEHLLHSESALAEPPAPPSGEETGQDLPAPMPDDLRQMVLAYRARRAHSATSRPTASLTTYLYSRQRTGHGRSARSR